MSIIEDSQKIEAKTVELVKSINKSITKNSIDKDYTVSTQIFYDFIKCGFIELQAPLIEKNDWPRVQLVTFDKIKSFSDLEGGRTIKPGNVILNLKKLIDSLPNIVALSASMAIDTPLLKVCSALCLWKEIRDVMTIEITRMQAIVIIALWRFCDCTHHISLDYGYKCVNYFCESIGEKGLSWDEYNSILDKLLKLHCIDIRDEVIWLCESIQKVWK